MTRKAVSFFISSSSLYISALPFIHNSPETADPHYLPFHRSIVHQQQHPNRLILGCATMPIRNPFARRPGALQQDEHQRPGSAASEATTTDAAHPGFERVDTVGSKASPAFSIRSSGGRRSQDTGEYKMSGMCAFAM